MKCLILLGTLAVGALFAQQDVRIHARDISQEGPVTRARGDATLSNATVRIQADSINYNRESGEAEATGNVRIKFLSKSGSTGLPASPSMTFEQRMRLLQQQRKGPPEIMKP